jgi:hypothetical protein
MCRTHVNANEKGTTLFEVLISAIVLSLIVLPIGLLLTTSNRTLRNTDINREVRSLMAQVMERIEATDLTKLWDAFGVEPDSPARFKGFLFKPEALSTAGGERSSDDANPLHLDIPLMNRIMEMKEEMALETDLEFRFMTRGELGIDASNRLVSKSGILHLQAGVVSLAFNGEVTKKVIEEEMSKPIYCPMILGRPGLLLSQCPAVKPELRDGKFKDFP